LPDDLDSLLDQQIAYYRGRASEYDQWFLREGRYDYGPEQRRRWFAEVAEVRRALDLLAPWGEVLELAAGTGWWTEQLLAHAERITAVDASPETITISRAKLGSYRVRYVQADLFTWTPNRRYDLVFFSFWLSHVPHDRFAAFWETVRDALAPGGAAYVIDSAFDPSSTAKDHAVPNRGAGVVTRKLNDGREFRIVKLFYRPDELASKLSALGWRADIAQTQRYFIYGSVEPVPASGRFE
jgi:demethylmenaquinone methyltransferase/2-methoxy-6-polyprenyl-1,4-benzoquinol methylase